MANATWEELLERNKCVHYPPNYGMNNTNTP
jgi:hypothetical protein